MSEKTIAQKARLAPGTRIALVDPVPGVVETLGLPPGTVFVDPVDATLMFLFVRTRADLESRLPIAVADLAPGSALWVFFRKGGRSAGVEVSRDDIWSSAERLQLRPLGLLSIDETWSAFRLRPSGPSSHAGSEGR
jgi:hypothetical protein